MGVVSWPVPLHLIMCRSLGDLRFLVARWAELRSTRLTSGM